jgi:hypothetical protein
MLSFGYFFERPKAPPSRPFNNRKANLAPDGHAWPAPLTGGLFTAQPTVGVRRRLFFLDQALLNGMPRETNSVAATPALLTIKLLAVLFIDFVLSSNTCCAIHSKNTNLCATCLSINLWKFVDDANASPF